MRNSRRQDGSSRNDRILVRHEKTEPGHEKLEQALNSVEGKAPAIPTWAPIDTISYIYIYIYICADGDPILGPI